MFASKLRVCSASSLDAQEKKMVPWIVSIDDGSFVRRYNSLGNPIECRE